MYDILKRIRYDPGSLDSQLKAGYWSSLVLNVATTVSELENQKLAWHKDKIIHKGSVTLISNLLPFLS
jgi:hypothetical protein